MPTYFCDGIKASRSRTTRRGPSFTGCRPPTAAPTADLIVALPAQGRLQALAMLARVRDGLIEEGLLKSPNFSSDPQRTACAPSCENKPRQTVLAPTLPLSQLLPSPVCTREGWGGGKLPSLVISPWEGGS
jgi:hypothetical protein